MATAERTLKISYCTTCKGRLHHLKQTLPANMAAEKDNPNVEFVVLDYGSEDGLGDWIKENFQKEMESGRLRYARYEARHFHYAHSRNMAHRLATGDVLCNVDADNFIEKDFSQLVRRKFGKYPQGIMTCIKTSSLSDLGRRLEGHVLGWSYLPSASMGGRVAVSKTLFETLHGYDEKRSAHGGEDIDFVHRANSYGAHLTQIPVYWLGRAIEHSNDERISQLSEKDRKISERNFLRPYAKKVYKSILESAAKRNFTANPGGNVGCGTIHINFSPEPTIIEPLTVGQAKPLAAQRATAEEIALVRRTGWAAGLKEPAPDIANGRGGR